MLIPSSTSLYCIDACPDMMVDACLCDGNQNLIFLSAWARDTALQEFLARLTLSSSEHGLDRFELITQQDSRYPILVGNIDRLEKRTTRVFRRSLFGSLVHLWLFDKRCVHPDKANSTALALLPKHSANRTERLWELAKETCPLPLLDHWRDTVLALLQSQTMLTQVPVSIGPLEGYQLALDVPTLTTALGELIRTDALSTSPVASTSRTRRRRAA
jgi:hypothetical protein